MDLIDPHTFNMMDQDSEGRIIPATSAREIRNLRINEYSKQGARVGMRGTRRTHNETFDFDTLGDDIIGVNPIDIVLVKFGALYNYPTITDIRGICADGWDIPTYGQCVSLQGYSGLLDAGIKLKEPGSVYWTDSAYECSNILGFNGRGAGKRDFSYGFIQLTERLMFYTKTYEDFPYSFYLSYESDLLLALQDTIEAGHSVRLIKNTTSLTHGQTGRYTGNDGKIYRTICINDQEWLADNLFETKFRTGELIPIITDDTAWNTLTTAGMCFYNNDPLNA